MIYLLMDREMTPTEYESIALSALLAYNLNRVKAIYKCDKCSNEKQTVFHPDPELADDIDEVMKLYGIENLKLIDRCEHAQ